MCEGTNTDSESEQLFLKQLKPHEVDKGTSPVETWTHDQSITCRVLLLLSCGNVTLSNWYFVSRG